jgi:hypothetical protein
MLRSVLEFQVFMGRHTVTRKLSEIVFVRFSCATSSKMQIVFCGSLGDLYKTNTRRGIYINLCGCGGESGNIGF